MTTSPVSSSVLPHHRLIAYQRCVSLAVAVKAAGLRDAKLRDQATRAVKSACLNTTEAASRASPADQARVFAIARAEAMEAVAAVEIAALFGDTSNEHAQRVVALGNEVYALLTRLIR